MSISKKEFEKVPLNEPKSQGTKQDRILAFLRKKKNRAYTAAEISQSLKMTDVSVQLMILRDRGKILHKRPYWMAK